MPVYLPPCLPACLCVCLFVWCLPVCLPVGFASLALFNLLRFPLMALPEALNHLFQVGGHSKAVGGSW